MIVPSCLCSWNQHVLDEMSHPKVRSQIIPNTLLLSNLRNVLKIFHPYDVAHDNLIIQHVSLKLGLDLPTNDCLSHTVNTNIVKVFLNFRIVICSFTSTLKSSKAIVFVENNTL